MKWELDYYRHMSSKVFAAQLVQKKSRKGSAKRESLSRTSVLLGAVAHIWAKALEWGRDWWNFNLRDSSACSVKNYTQSWQLLCPEALSKLRRSVTATWCSALCGEAWTCRADSFFLHAMPEPTRRVPSHVCKAEDSIKSINATASVKIAAAGPNLEFLMMLFFPSVRVISFEAIACLHLIMVD